MTQAPRNSFSGLSDLCSEAVHPTAAQKTLKGLLEAQFSDCPDAVAVMDPGGLDQTLTYADLDRRSAAFASMLATHDIGPESLVAISLPRSADLVVAVLGIIRAGAAYMPINPDDPEARRIALLEQAFPAALIAHDDIGPFKAMAPLVSEADAPVPQVAVSPETLAYVLFTSGSSGAPKGVMVEHGSVANFLLWQIDEMDLGADDRVLFKSPMTFDVSVMELFLPLLCGGTVLIAPQGAEHDPREVVQLVRDHGVTMAHFVPAMLGLFVDVARGEDLALRNVMTGGEELKADLKARYHRTIKGRLQHSYGPTEAAIGVTYFDAHADDGSDPVPIGRPTWNTRLYILSDDGELLGPKATGRLWIAGHQVARGYLGREDLTAERFRPDPFVDGERMYDSGDLAEWRDDGALIFKGRADFQVKVGGIRLELGEVEAALDRLEAINQAVVVDVPCETSGETRLVGYCLSDCAFDPDALRSALSETLPRHAIPARLIRLETLPFASSGKVDRKALQVRGLPSEQRAKGERTATQGNLARSITEALAEILGRDASELDGAANFFDLGATSLQLVRLRETLRTRLDQTMPMSVFFRHSNIDALAAHLGAAAEDLPKARALPKETREVTHDHIAIVGMAGRFPGAPDVSALWESILEGRELISHFTEDELEIDPRTKEPNTRFVLSRGVLDAPEMFDADHFGIAPREAERMDPQHRILLELARTALDDAGHDPERFAGKIGVFAGASQNSYLLANLVSAPGAARALAAGFPVSDMATQLGNDKDFVATRIAYKLGLRGPAVTVQTACSTSLVAVGQGCDALRAGHADMVLAGGVSITFPTKRPYAYLPEGMTSKDGHCRTFDAEATGTVFGDGAGLVVLRRLEDALADGDSVIAVIRGHAVNNDGSDKVGYAAPSIQAQAEVIEAAHAAAKVNPRDIGYVEAHGTATPLGDPIEFTALQTAFEAGTEERGFCAIGSIKTNVGHLDAAAGVTGLIKTALVLKHGVIPPLLHYSAPNPQIDFEASAFYPAADEVTWDQGTRRAGVSSFGVGGTNIHMVVESAGEANAAPVQPVSRPRVFPLSATSTEALGEAAKALGAFARANPEADPDRVVATLRHGRTAFETRGVLVANDMATLASLGAEGRIAPVKAARREAIAFLFPGQGAQHVGMARHLAAAEPVFRDALDRCCDLLMPELGLDLRDVIHAPAADAEAMTERLRNTALAQPAIFAVEYALVQQWAHWGIEPDAMVGHSIGEFAAATVSGVMDLADALRLIALRGRLMADLPEGAMISVRASEEVVRGYLGCDLDLAAVNGAAATVVAGPEAAAEQLLARLADDGIEASRLKTSHAFHSRMMDPALEAFRAAVAEVRLQAPTIPILSTVTGDWLSDAQATDPFYWANHMRQPVRFHDAMEVLRAEARHTLIETGPGRTLSTLARQAPDRSRAQPAFASLPHAQAGDVNDHHELLAAFGTLWAAGHEVDWSKLDGDREPAQRLSGLPTYPFQRKRHWVEADTSDFASATDADHEKDTLDNNLDDEGDVKSVVTVLLSDLSGYGPDDLPGSVPFLELGFDSLLLTQVAREIGGRFKVTLALRELIDGLETIDALSDYISQHGDIGSGTPSPVRKATETPAPASSPDPSPPTSAPLTSISRESEALSPGQTAHIARLVERFNAKTAKSKALTQEYRPVHADPRTASGFNRLWKDLVYQIVSDRSKGSRIIDIDGNEYVDLLNGFGPGFLGHNHDMIRAALDQQMDKGYEVGPQHLVAMEAAQLFCEVTGNERASFVCTGSEAVYAAMRLARTVTGRDTIVTFRRDYHGNFDEVLVRGVDGQNGPQTLPLAPGIPRDAVKNMVTLPYGTPESLDWIRKNAASLAAVVVEPVQSRRPEFRPAEFIRGVRDATERGGALMIFDEVVTGFRFGPRGAQALYGIEADLVTYGKIVGGELPIGVVAGKARFMDTFDGGQWRYGDDSFPEAPVTFFAGTFVRHPLAMAAAHAMLTHFKALPDLYWPAINAKGDRLGGTLSQWFRDNDLPFEMPNCGSMLYFRVAEDQKFGGLFGAHLRDRGVFYLESFPSYLTASHDDEDIDHVIDAFKDAALEMRADGMLTGIEPVGHDGPMIDAAPPRLSLPDGSARIGAAMAEVETTFEMPSSEAQREIWTALRITPDLQLAYNECTAIELRGAGIDLDALSRAVTAAVSRHDVLGAVFTEAGKTLRLGATSPQIDVLDLSGVVNADAAVDALIDMEVEQAFDLVAGPLARFKIVRRGPEAVDIILSAHHIIFDGWSAGTMLRDICQCYCADITGGSLRLPPPDSPVEYSRRERLWTEGTGGQEARAFWSETFADMPEPVLLPSDRPRGETRVVDATRLDVAISPEMTERLRAAARSMGATLFTTLFAGFKLFVASRTGQTDLTIAVPSAGQPSYGLDNLVFQGVNLMPVRSGLDLSVPFRAFAKDLGRQVATAREHQKLTYGSIVKELGVARSLARMPLTVMSFNLDPAFSEEELDFNGVPARFTVPPRRASNFEIELNLADKGDQIVAEWTYQTAVFDRETIEGFMDAYLSILDRAMATPEIETSALISATAEDLSVLGPAATGPRKDLPEMPIQSLVARRAALHHEAKAIDGMDDALSYGALDGLANRIAAMLVSKGVAPGDRVCLAMERSARAIASLLGILKAGGVYVPLDLTHPVKRLEAIIADTEATLVLADPEAVVLFKDNPVTVVVPEDKVLPADAEAPNVSVLPTAPAYIYFTSGSTGTPKGVTITHRNFVNFIASMAEAPGLYEGQRILALTTLCFDIAGLEIWGPLIHGGTVVVATSEEALDVARLETLIARCDLIQATPTRYRMLLEAGWRGKSDLVALVGGEMVPRDLADALRARCREVWNVYGPTETTVWASACRLGDGPVHVGHPVANSVFRVVAPGPLCTLPPGAVGELLIGGVSVSRGYHNRSDLTAERFVTLSEGDAEMLFHRTGDLARFIRTGDGWTTEILGRLDGQVKIRGFRVDVGDVESALRSAPGVAEAAVLVIDEGTPGAQLVCLATTEAGGEADVDLWRQTLADTLPPYMIPSRILAVEALPVLASGKLNRKALRELYSKAVAECDAEGQTRTEAPSTEMERLVVGLWSEIFETGQIRLEDNFFHLGGHSLMAVQLFELLRQREGLDLPISMLFRYQVARDLARALEEEKERKMTVDGIGKDGAEVPFDPDAPWDASVVIHPGPDGSEDPAVFIVGGVGGNVNNLFELGQALGQSRKVVGFLMRGVVGHTPRTSIEAMAADYVEQVRRHQPRGPYVIAGYSAGAYTALEMARQLEAMGETVANLMPIDMRAPGFTKVLEKQATKSVTGLFMRDEARLLRRSGFGNFFWRLKTKALSRLAKGPVREVSERFSALPERYTVLKEAWWRAAEVYEAKPVDCLITLFLANPTTPSDIAAMRVDPSIGWGSLARSGSITILKVEGGHLDMIEGAHASSFAARVLSVLEAAPLAEERG